MQEKFGDKLKPVNDGIAREGAFYLFALRLVPAFPFVAINLLMGLTLIRTWTYDGARAARDKNRGAARFDRAIHPARRRVHYRRGSNHLALDRVMHQFQKEGVKMLVNHKAKQFIVENGEKILICEHDGREVRVPFDALLCAVGRIANTRGYGLEELGIPVTKMGTVEVNEFMQTIYPNIYACGDVAGPYQFTHTAAHTAWYSAVNALFGSLRKFRADFSVIPWATFTDRSQ